MVDKMLNHVLLFENILVEYLRHRNSKEIVTRIDNYFISINGFIVQKLKKKSKNDIALL